MCLSPSNVTFDTGNFAPQLEQPKTLQELRNCSNWAKKGLIERNAWLVCVVLVWYVHTALDWHGLVQYLFTLLPFTDVV